MNKKKETGRKSSINPRARITSTSDLTLEDIVDFVAQSLPNAPCRGKITQIVKETVRPCAIGGVPTVVAGGTGSGVPGCGIGSFQGADNGAEIILSAPGCITAPGAGVPPVTDPGDIILRPRQDSRKSSKAVTAGPGVNSKWYGLVLQNGEVWTPYTSRRFLPMQYLSLMEASHGNIDAAIASRYSLRDCFRLMRTEIEKLIFMRKHWVGAFNERSLFLTVEDCRRIFSEYLKSLAGDINNRARCNYAKRAGEFWRKLQGVGRVVLWTRVQKQTAGLYGATADHVSVDPTVWLVDLNRQIEVCESRVRCMKTYEDALDVIDDLPNVGLGSFRDSNGHIRNWLPKTWKACFKKQGAYYTLKSLIVNRHVRYTTEYGSWNNKQLDIAPNAREGLTRLAKLLDESVPAYVVHAILKKSIEASKFNVAAFVREIHMRKRNRWN